MWMQWDITSGDPALLWQKLMAGSEPGRDVIHWHGKREGRGGEESELAGAGTMTKECLRPRSSGREGRERSSCNKPYRIGHGRELQCWHWGLA